MIIAILIVLIALYFVSSTQDGISGSILNVVKEPNMSQFIFRFFNGFSHCLHLRCGLPVRTVIAVLVVISCRDGCTFFLYTFEQSFRYHSLHTHT